MPGNPPHDLVAIVISPYEIYLSWVNGENADPYQNIQVWRKIGGGTYTHIANIPAFKTSYMSGGLEPGTLHCYYLVGEWWEPPGETEPSNEECKTTYVLLQKPSDPEAKAFSNFIELTWRDNSSAEDEFRIDRKEGAGEWVENYAAVPANVEYFRDTAVTPGETYAYILRALELPDSFSGYTDEVAATANSLPGQAQNLQVPDKQDTWVRLTWEPPSSGGEVTGYRIERSTNGTDYSEIAVVDSDVFTYLAKGLTANTEYWFRVRPYNGVGNGDYAYLSEDREYIDDFDDDLIGEEWSTHNTDANRTIVESGGVLTIAVPDKINCRWYYDKNDTPKLYQPLNMTLPIEIITKINSFTLNNWGTAGLFIGYYDAIQGGKEAYLYTIYRYDGVTEGTKIIKVPTPVHETQGNKSLPKWFKIKIDVSEVITFWYSEDGIDWTQHPREVNDWYLPDMEVGLFAGSIPASYPNGGIAAPFEFFSMSGKCTYVVTREHYQRSEYEVFIRDPSVEPVYIAEIDLKMDLSGFVLVDGEDYTYEITIDERGLEIDSVWENGDALAEKPIEEVEATAESWCWDSAARKLYVHSSTGADPDDFFMEGGFVHRIPNREFAHADSICTLPPWLSAKSIPGATQEIKPYYEGNFRLSTGSISFINAESNGEHYFDRRFEKFTWIGAKLSIYLGKETFDSLAKFKKMFTAYVSKHSINDGRITFSLADIREDLDRNFVLDKYRLDDYPGASEEEEWDFEGREKPKGYGYIEAVAPTPIMVYDAAESRSAKFSYHDERTKSVGKVTVNDIEKAQDADYYADLKRSVIVFDKGVEILENDIVLVSFSAQVNSADEVIEKGADVFKHFMNVEAKIPTPGLNTDWIYETKYANTKSMSAYFYKDTPFNEIIRNIEHTTEAYILQDGEGRIGLRPQQTEVESGAENIWDFQSKGHEHDKDKDSLFWKVKVNFAEDPQLQEWQTKEATDDRIKWKYRVEKELPVNCYFRDPANAQALANNILGLCNKTYIEDELPMILFDVFPGDLIPFSRTRFFDLSGTANEIALRILKIEKNPQSGKTSVRMEKA